MIHLLSMLVTETFNSILQNFIKKDYIHVDINYQNKDYHLDFSQMFFGINFEEHVKQNLSENEILKVKTDLLDYYIKFCDELKKRFDFSDSKVQLLKYLNPKKIQEGNLSTILPIVEAFPYNEVSLEELNTQWRSLIMFSKEKVESIYDSNIITFWKNISKETNILENLMFKELADYMCILATLPHSSAAAERVFSIMNDVKSKKRNRLNVKTVESIMYAKQLIYSSSSNIFEPTLELIKYFNNFNFVNGKYVRK